MSEPRLARMRISYVCIVGVISHESSNCAEVRHHETYIFSAFISLPPTLSVFEVSQESEIKVI